MRNGKLSLVALTLITLSVSPADAGGIDDLAGKHAFDWATDPETVKCEKVGDELLAKFKSSTFTCNLTPITNTASGFPAQVCTDGSERSEYLIFATEAECEEERQTQASNE